MTDIITEFRHAMADAGLAYAGRIEADKRIHRFSADGETGDSCWYKLHPDGDVPAGAFGCWKRNLSQKWHAKVERKLTSDEYARLQKTWREAEEQRRKDDLERQERFADKAEAYVAACKPAKANHLYLESKKVGVHGGLVQDAEGCVVLPLRDITGKVWSYQAVDPFGDKRFMTGGRVQGCFALLGEMNSGPLVVCEGYATGASILEATGWPVACAMNCGNLREVCRDLRKAHPLKLIVVAGDDDRFTKRGEELYNPGAEKATEAARDIKATLVLPAFPKSSKGTDFNDLAVESGEQSVRNTFHGALGIGMGQMISLKDLLFFVPGEDPDSILGDRYLCRGGSCVIVAQTSVGKSSLSMQMAILWALGMDFYGLKSPRKEGLRSLIVQAENDLGDTAEMFQGILLGMGLVSEQHPEENVRLMERLQKKLIIIRDQTHIGASFPKYAEKLVEIHKPDLFWIDPMLSFYGADINDQKEMSNFLRGGLNPISERTGVIWMLLHHTGKPAREEKGRGGAKSARDFAYLGIGSSELSNWARAIMCIVATSDDEFRLILAKRGRRANMTDDHGHPATEINLAHSGEHICWKRIPKPKDDDEMDEIFSTFVRGLECKPMTATTIVKKFADKAQRGVRTCWKFWDGGEGPLGKLFVRDGVGFYTPRDGRTSKPYADD